MPIFPPEFLEQIRSRASLIDIAGGKTRLVRRGKNWFGCCPFHNEKTPSFKIDAERDFYYCFGCGAHGDLFSFVMESEKVDFSTAVELLADKAGLALPHLEPNIAQELVQKKHLQTLLNDALSWFQKMLLSEQGNAARTYLAERGIDQKMWEKFALGFAPKQTALATYLTERGYNTQDLIESGLYALSKRATLFERFRGRLMFPILDERGHPVGFGGRILETTHEKAKYINSPESKIFDKSTLLYGYTLARQSSSNDPVLIVEGYLDVIALHQAEFDKAVAPLGTSANAHQIQACWKLCAEPVVMFDGDQAGQTAAIRLLKRLLGVLQPGYSVRFAFLPAGEDPDSFVRKKGRAALQMLIQQARSLVDVLWTHTLQNLPHDTPEQRAFVLEHIKATLSEITHHEIRRFYRDAFRERWHAKRDHPVPQENLRLPQTTQLVSHTFPFKILLATLIGHPDLFKTVEDLFLDIPLQDPALEQVKDSLFELLNTHSFENSKNLIQELKLRISESALRSILNKEIFQYAPFARSDAHLVAATTGFQDVWKRFFVAPSLGRDIQQAKLLLESSFDITHWKRLQELHALWEQETIGSFDVYDDHNDTD
ncbi:MAG: DNA primase [Holosporales bacterium]|nr:DNA primase [Holosporales bacterium]